MYVSFRMPTLHNNIIENMFYCLKLKMMQQLQLRIEVKGTFSEISYINTRNQTLVSYAVEATNLLKTFIQFKSEDKRRWRIQHFGNCSNS